MSIKPQQFQFVQQDPTVKPYKARISAGDWSHYKNIIEDWHDMGKTRNETLSVLKRHFSFEPSLAQLNAQMAVWGLQTYKKVGCQHEAEEHHKLRKYISFRVNVQEPASVVPTPPFQFVLSWNSLLKGILKVYIEQVRAGATAFNNFLWKTISASEMVQSSCPRYELRSYKKLEHIGDFLLAGRSLRDAFDTYSFLIYIRMIFMNREKCFVKRAHLIGLVIKCSRSAESDEQKKLAFELLELCLLNQSITGLLTYAISGSLRQYYTEKNPSQNCHLEPSIWKLPDDTISELYSQVLPTFIFTHGNMNPSWLVKKHSELYLPIQHAIYAQLWRNMHINFSYLDSYNTEALAPNLQLCEILATAAHILAQNILERGSVSLFGSIEASGSRFIPVRRELLRLLHGEMCSMAILDKHNPATKSQEVGFRDSLQARYQDDSHIHKQCMQWLQEQVFASMDSCPSLSILRDLPLGVVHEEKVKGSAAALTNETDAIDIDMVCSSHGGGPQPSLNDEPSSEMTQSVYFRSSSTPNSMRSMLSMASRIRRNAHGSPLSRTSQRSSPGMAMSISSNFDFDRVTGMGSVSLADHSMDIMETDEASTAEEDMNEVIYERYRLAREQFREQSRLQRSKHAASYKSTLRWLGCEDRT